MTPAASAHPGFTCLRRRSCWVPSSSPPTRCRVRPRRAASWSSAWRRVSHHGHPYLGRLSGRRGLRHPADEPVRAPDRPVHPTAHLWRCRQGAAHVSMTVATRNALRTGTVLFLFALVGTAMLAFTHDQTEPVITRSQRAEKLALINQCCPLRPTTTTCWPAARICRRTISWARASLPLYGSPAAAARSPPWYWKPSRRTAMLAISPC